MQNEYAKYVDGLEEKKLLTDKGIEYWMGRDLMGLLAYTDWRNFSSVMEKAIIAARESGVNPDNHFVETNEMVSIGSGAQREREDWFLTRYACYLIAMNGDSSKQPVSFAMTYFAGQTRKQEIQDQLTEEQKRLDLRLRVLDNTKNLNAAAKDAGVQRFGLFNDGGIRGMYGMSLAELKAYKKLGPKEDLLDHADRLELAATDFRLTLTEHRLRQEEIKSEPAAIKTHKEVGREVRHSVMRDNKGLRPEDLPKSPSIRPLLDQHRRRLKSAKSPKDEAH